MFVEIATLSGSAFIDPAFVAAVADGDFRPVVILTSGEQIQVTGTAAEVVQQIMMEAF